MKINIELSKKSIDEAIKKLNKLKTKYPWIKSEFVKRSLIFIESEANKNIKLFIAETNSAWYQSTGKLESSWIHDVAHGILENICDYAMWYEYGTGIVGANNSHPSLKPEYVYDMNNHGENGWSFTYEGERYFTKGMKSHPYLHNAVSTYIRTKKYKEIFKSVVAEAEKGV